MTVQAVEAILKMNGWAYTAVKGQGLTAARFNVKFKRDENSPYDDTILLTQVESGKWRFLLKIELDEKAIAHALMFCNEWLRLQDVCAGDPIPYVDIKAGVFYYKMIINDYCSDDNFCADFDTLNFLLSNDFHLMRHCGVQFRENSNPFKKASFWAGRPVLER